MSRKTLLSVGGLSAQIMHRQSALLLGGCDLLLVFAAWLLCRFPGTKKYGADFLRVAGNFALMVLVWGVFQIAFAFTMKLWTAPSMEPLLRHFAQTESTGTPQTASGSGGETPDAMAKK